MSSKMAEIANDKARIHSHALVDEGAQLGERTRVWAFAHILSGAVIGEDCNICDHTFVEGQVILGDRVTVKCGVYLWDGVTAEDDVFIGPAAVFTNDLKPRSREYPASYAQTLLKQGCSIGANSTIAAGIVVGAWSMIGLGSIVTKSVADYAVVWGTPATFKYWMCRCTKKLDFGNSKRAVCECGKSYELDSEAETVKLCS